MNQIAGLSTSKRWALIGLFCLLLALTLALARASTPEATRPEIPIDPYDADPAKMEEARRHLSRRPALQELPLNTRQITADIHDKTANGALVIKISYTGSKRAAQRTWRSFLNYVGDRSSYRTIYVAQR